MAWRPSTNLTRQFFFSVEQKSTTYNYHCGNLCNEKLRHIALIAPKKDPQEWNMLCQRVATCPPEELSKGVRFGKIYESML